jgi:nucleotide-binding universal stress UspA family protein
VVNDRAGEDTDDADHLGGGRIPLRFLVGLDARATIPDLVAYVGTAGANGRAIARVVHVVELAGRRDRLAMESVEEASDVIDEAVFSLRMSGVGADGIVRHGRMDRIGLVLLEEAAKWHADAVILRGRRGRSWRRLLGPGVREQVLRQSRTTTVLVSRQTNLASQLGIQRWSRRRR